MSNIFERDYQMLELDKDAEWADARKNYRRLVNRWHPDRFTSRPRERQHAQTRFIEVTKSYKALREYHRHSGRLPMQDPALRDAKQSFGTPPEPSQNSAGHTSRGVSVTQEIGASSSFSPAGGTQKTQPRVWLWALMGCALIGTVALFIVLEKRLSEKTRQDAIEVLRETQPSEFLPKNN